LLSGPRAQLSRRAATGRDCYADPSGALDERGRTRLGRAGRAVSFILYLDNQVRASESASPGSAAKSDDSRHPLPERERGRGREGEGEREG
jgi:hypothetical protein